jgi:ABC-2 type transport system permease protein
VLPGLFQLGAQLIDWFADIQPWVDFAAAQNPLIEGNVNGEQWAQLAVSGLLWLGLPLAVGLWRVLRAEVK